MASDGAHHQRAMVVVAHADDAEWGCAGTVAKWCAEGWEVVYVLCTDGSKGSEDPEMTSGRLVEIRKQEQLDAGKVLGLKDIVFLGYEDSMLEPTLELRRDIAREIRRHRPDVLICMNPVRSVDGEGYLGHPDHFASGEAALSAVFPSSREPPSLALVQLSAPDMYHAPPDPLVHQHPHLLDPEAHRNQFVEFKPSVLRCSQSGFC